MEKKPEQPLTQLEKLALKWGCPHHSVPKSFSCCDRGDTYFVGKKFPGVSLDRNQAECIFWAAQGFTGPEISKKLGIPTRVANSRICTIVKKLGFPGRKELVTRFNSGILLKSL